MRLLSCFRWFWCAALALGLGCSPVSGTAPENDPYAARREELVRRYVVRGSWAREAVRDARVIAAMRAVPRHEFVPKSAVRRAYEDHPLPIGYGQTISQPSLVAYMTEILGVDEDSIVLEIGTGSGYQAAILAEIVEKVYSIEIVEPLGTAAAKRLKRLGYDNVETKVGDGYFGWEEKGPFDGIIVTAAASHIPPPLIEQLKPGARMVIPVGPPLLTQYLMLLEKRADGSIVKRNVMAVAFVPLTGGKPKE